MPTEVRDGGRFKNMQGLNSKRLCNFVSVLYWQNMDVGWGDWGGGGAPNPPPPVSPGLERNYTQKSRKFDEVLFPRFSETAVKATAGGRVG